MTDDERRRHDKAWNDPPLFSFDELNKAPKSNLPLSKRYKYPVPDQQSTANPTYGLPTQTYQNQGNYAYNQQQLTSPINSNQYQQINQPLNYNYLSQQPSSQFAPQTLSTQKVYSSQSQYPTTPVSSQPQYSSNPISSQPQYPTNQVSYQTNQNYNPVPNYNLLQQQPAYLNTTNSVSQMQYQNYSVPTSTSQQQPYPTMLNDPYYAKPTYNMHSTANTTQTNSPSNVQHTTNVSQPQYQNPQNY